MPVTRSSDLGPDSKKANIRKKRNGLLAAPRKVSHERTGHRAAIPCRVPCSRSSRPAAMPRLRLHLRGRFMHSCHSCLSHAFRTNTLHLSSLALLQHAGSFFCESFCSSYGHAVLPIGRDDSTGMRCCGCSRRLSLLGSDRSRCAGCPTFAWHRCFRGSNSRPCCCRRTIIRCHLAAAVVAALAALVALAFAAAP